MPLDEWERWAVIHAGELAEDGITPRFRRVLILVARQNGKTFLLRVLTLYWLFVEEWPVVYGTSTDRKYAKKDWRKVCDMALGNPMLRAMLPDDRKKEPGVTTQIGEEALTTAAGCEFTFGANNRRAGRSLSIDRLKIDELREHRDWDAWNACTNAMNARPYGQVYCITNQGDDQGIVLDSIHSTATAELEDPSTDIGLFEWSPPRDADPFDPHTWAYANPNLNRRMPQRIIQAAAKLAKAGPKELADFKTEILCLRVSQLNAAINPQAWADGHEDGHLMDLGQRIAAVLDIAPDRRHATLVGAGKLPDGRVRVQTIRAWDGPNTTADVRKSLSGLLTAANARVFGWIPNGPGAAMAADLKDRTKTGRQSWPPRGVKVEEIRGEVSAICMGLAEFVDAGGVVHNNDSLLNDHVTGAAKLSRGSTWIFDRQDDGHCDAAYAVAGAVHLARTMPASIGKPRYLELVETPDE